MRRILISLVIVAVLGGGGYYGYITYFPAQPAVAEEPVLQTAQVRRGDLVLRAGGVGTLFAGDESKVGFRSGGIVKDVAVQVGDRVEVGQVLASLDDADVRSQLTLAGINLRLAEIALAELEKEAGGAELAAAQANLAAAQADYDRLVTPPTAEEIAAAQDELYSAQQTLNTLLAGPSQDTLTTLQADLRSAEIALSQAQTEYDKVAWRADVGRTPQAAALETATLVYNKALAQYNISAAGASEDAVASARARVFQAQNNLNVLLQGADSMDVAAAEAKVAQNRAALEELTSGPAVEDLEKAQLSAQQARLTVSDVLRDVNGTIVRAPIAGVVTSVSAQPGDAVGAGPIIGLADTNTAQVRFWIEELDIAAAIPGNPVSIVFEAFPEHTFNGQITRVEPALVQVEGASAIQAWASIDMNEHPVPLLFGMNAEVEIVAGESLGTLLVPVQALRELAPGQYAVFVVDPNGELEFRPVQVGLKDFVVAEILSGLELGETVSTGDVQTE